MIKTVQNKIYTDWRKTTHLPHDTVLQGDQFHYVLICSATENHNIDR
jgi:hypothetical protein